MDRGRGRVFRQRRCRGQMPGRSRTQGREKRGKGGELPGRQELWEEVRMKVGEAQDSGAGSPGEAPGGGGAGLNRDVSDRFGGRRRGWKGHKRPLLPRCTCRGSAGPALRLDGHPLWAALPGPRSKQVHSKRLVRVSEPANSLPQPGRQEERGR